MTRPLFIVSSTKQAMAIEKLTKAALSLHRQSLLVTRTNGEGKAKYIDSALYLVLIRLQYLARPLFVAPSVPILRPSRFRRHETIHPFTTYVRGWRRKYKTLLTVK